MNSEYTPTLNILAAYPIFTRKYGLTMPESDFIEEAYLALRDINSTPVKIYYHVDKPTNRDEMLLTVPCNLSRIISITAAPLNSDGYKDYEPYRKSSRIGHKENMNTLTGNTNMKTYHFNDAPYTGLGSYIEFEWVDETTIKILDTRLWDKEIHIVYEGVVVDNEGLPMITLKHARAIAAKVALTIVTHRMFRGDPTVGNLLPFLQQESGRLVQAAAIPEHITDNELDKWLNERVRHDRKRYNRSFKFNRS
ncbi:MAG: hypothetical protein KAH32_04700 [Chlamydiia bacterium]|nr:hypothetical protein [Chlamydiia bacterium]